MGLLTCQDVKDTIALVVGNSGLTNVRVKKLLEYGTKPIVITCGKPSEEVEGAQYLNRAYKMDDLVTLGREEVENVVDSVYVTLSPAENAMAREISQQCKRKRIPVNVADQPDLCTFTLLSCHADGDFQVGVTTSGKGCRLANRLRRHIVNSLPSNVGEICTRVGDLKRKIQEEDLKDSIEHEEYIVGQEDDDAEQHSRFNDFVSERNESIQQRKKRRMRWLSQIVEYYPLEKLASIEVDDLAQQYSTSPPSTEGQPQKAHQKGKISLVGAGPGSDNLLTTGALKCIHSADLILADKLVPQPVLDLIPRTTPVEIAKKFPGNAERAQQELLEMGITGLREGKHVVRLKQGDPYIFGRGAEEYIYFSEHGYTPEVISGVTSALSAPLLANIPATHRNVADQLLVCTGTGRAGALPNLPEWVPSRTTVFLMALHRIQKVVDALVETKGWDINVPCAVIERSSCPDQRVIRTTLKNVAEAIEACGSRPPGLLVTGYSCEVIEKHDQKWIVEDGLSNDQ